MFLHENETHFTFLMTLSEETPLKIRTLRGIYLRKKVNIAISSLSKFGKITRALLEGLQNVNKAQLLDACLW